MIITRRFREKGWKSSETRTKHHARNHRKTNKSANPQHGTPIHPQQKIHIPFVGTQAASDTSTNNTGITKTPPYTKNYGGGKLVRGCRKEPWGTQKRASNSNIDHIGYAKHEAIWFCGSSTADFSPTDGLLPEVPRSHCSRPNGPYCRTSRRQSNLITS